MQKIKKALSVLVVIILVFSITGCKNNNIKSETSTSSQTNAEANISKPNIQMKTVTQNSKADLITFKYELPEQWEYRPEYFLSAYGYDAISPIKNIKTTEEALPAMIIIDNYNYARESGSNVPEKTKQAYKNLIEGKTEAYQDFINEYVTNINAQYNYTYSNTGSKNDSANGSETSSQTPANFFDFIDKLTSSNNSSKPEIEKKYIRNFKQRKYNGKNGKIIEVQYTYDYAGKTFHAINCIREDIPYVVWAGFDNSLEVSSGDIAPWVANSLTVTEHFTMENGKIKKKD